MLEEISQSDSAASWPAEYEWRMQAWGNAGDPGVAQPFVDRYDIVTLEFFERSRLMRWRYGGWLYWTDELGPVVFAPEPEWQRVRAEHEAEQARWRR